MNSNIYGDGKPQGGAAWEDKSRILCGLGRFNICISYPGIDVQLTVN